MSRPSRRRNLAVLVPIRGAMLVVAAVLAAGADARAETLAQDADLVGGWDGFKGNYADVWGDGDHAYLGHFGAPSLDIIDVSDPANPVHLTQYDLPEPNTKASAQDVKVANGLLFISLEGGGNSVHIVDVRDPANPVGLTDITIKGFLGIHNTFYHDGYLYMADSNTPRVGIVDLTTFDPDAPPAGDITQVKWMLENVGTSIVHDVTVAGNRLYVSAWDSGVHVYALGDVAVEPPAFLGAAPGDNTHSCWPTDDGKYVVAGEERSGGGIVAYRILLNFTMPPSVSLIVTDTVALPTTEANSVHNQVMVGNRVFNSWYQAGLRAYDLDPKTGLLTLAAIYDPQPGSAWGVYPFLGTDRVLVSDIQNGLLVVDVTAPVPGACDGDFDEDGSVGFGDLNEVLSAWGPCAGCAADLDGDDSVGFADLNLVLSAWGPCG